MKIIFAGTSHGVPDRKRACSSLFLVMGESTYIIDGGADISHLLDFYGLSHKSVKAIFITHPHTDHFDGMPAFCDQLLWYHRYDECVPKFFFPEKRCQDALDAWIKIMQPHGPYRRDGFDFNIYEAGEIYSDENVKFTAIKNLHMESAYSFFVECVGKKLFFTGDLGYSFGEYLDILGDRFYDLVVCEGAHHNPGTVNEMLKKTPTKHLIMNHLHPAREDELVKLKGDTPFEFQLATDGLIVNM